MKTKRGISIITAAFMLLGAFPLNALAEKNEADTAKAAEEAMVRKAADAFSEEFKKTNEKTLSELGVDIYENEKSDNIGADIELMSANGTYSEIKDINTVDDLLAIDGHSGGYYHLRNDLDLSGMEWKPLFLPDAVIEGHGHTISGMTITDISNYDNNVDSIGFIGYTRTYIRDLKLKNFKMDIALNSDQEIPDEISPMGGGYNNGCENCEISGDMNILMDFSRHEGAQTYIEILKNSTNVRADVDLNITHTNESSASELILNIMKDCVNCELYGDIDASYAQIGTQEGEKCYYNHIFSNCSGCKRYGDLKLNGNWLYFMEAAENCENRGKIDCENMFDIQLLNGCENCLINGKITENRVIWYNDYPEMNECAIGVISGSENCTVEGDITTRLGGIYVMSDSSDCACIGDISAGDYIYGIYCGGLYGEKIKNCRIYGNLTSKAYITGIDNGDNCLINGNLRAPDILGISDRSNRCRINGNLIASIGVCGMQSSRGDLTNNTINGNIQGGTATGIGNGASNAIIGNITATNGDAKGIMGAESSTIRGKVTAVKGNVTGMSGAKSSTISGNVTTSKGDAIGMSGSTSSTIGGNVTTADGTAYGFDTFGCTIDGTVSATHNGYSGTASKTTNEIYIIRCSLCGTLIGTADETVILEGYGHCYRYNDDGTSEAADAGKVETLAQYGPKSGGGGGGGGGEGGGGSITPPAMPSMAPVSYMLQIIDTQTQAPLPNAQVTIDSQSYVCDDNGMVTFAKEPTVGLLKVEYDGNLIYNTRYFSPYPNRVNKIYTKGLSLNAKDLDLGNSGDAVMEGPKVNLFGKKTPLFQLPLGVDVEFFDSCEIAYDKDQNLYQVIIDLGEDDDEDDDEDNNTGGGSDDDSDSTPIQDANSSSWADKFNSAKMEFEIAENTSMSVELDPDNLELSNKGKLGIDGEINAKTFLELRPEGNGLKLVDGGAFIKFEGSYTGGIHLPPPASVAYVAFGVSGEFSADAKISPDDDSSFIKPKFTLSSDISAELTPYLGVGLGLQETLCVEAGLKGQFDMGLALPITTIDDQLKINFTGKMYFLAVLLCLRVNLEKDFLKTQLYPNFGEDFELASVDSVGDFELIDRSYLNKSDTAELMSLEGVKDTVYPYGGVKTAKLSDGRVVMVWLDDDTARNMINKTALYYSVLSSGVWSEPAQIESDGTADFEFDLKAYGDKAAIVWQDMKDAFEESDNLEEIVNEMSANSALSYSVFDGSAWSAPLDVAAEHDGYKYDPSLYYGADGAHIAWLENASGSAVPSAETENMIAYSVKINGSSAGEIKQKYGSSDKPLYITDVEAGADGTTAVIVDTDGDYMTDGSSIYIDGTEKYRTGNAIWGLQYIGENYYFTESGSIKYIGAWESYPKTLLESGADKISYVENGYNKALLYEVQNTDSEAYESNLYASYYKDNQWTNPVPITEFTGEKVRSWDAYFDDDGTLSVSAILAKNIPNDTARLVSVKADPLNDLAITSLASSGDIIPDAIGSFVIRAVNNTQTDISSLDVTLTGENSGELYNETVDADIPAGEAANIVINANIPSDFTSQNVTAKIASSGITDACPENDSVSSPIGYGNLSVEMRGYSILNDGTAEVTVKNTGCDPVTGASLKVTAENGNEIYTSNLGTVKGGEKKSITIDIDEKYYTFTDSYTSFVMNAAVTSENGDAISSDNETVCSVYPKQAEDVRALQKQIVLQTGQTYQSQFKVYPEEYSDDAAIYYISSDPNVAEVDENGMITAVANGTANITAMIAESETAAAMSVYVRDMTAPEITKAIYENHGDLDYVRGNIELSIDTSECLLNGEKEQIITAVYAEDGSLMCVNINEITGSNQASPYNISTSEKVPKRVKIMIWDSINGMKPVALTAESELTEITY